MPNRRVSAVIGGIGLFLVALGIAGAMAAFDADVALTWVSLAIAGALAFAWSVLTQKPQTPPDSKP
jgi:hypothetical protein